MRPVVTSPSFASRIPATTRACCPDLYESLTGSTVDLGHPWGTWARVKRLALLVLAFAAFAPATANASVPCRDRIYNDWYADGKIATTYPLGCYRDALKHVPTDARTYSS